MTFDEELIFELQERQRINKLDITETVNEFTDTYQKYLITKKLLIVRMYELKRNV